MIPETIIPLRARAAKHNFWAMPRALKRLGRTRLALSSGGNHVTHAVENAYLLVLAAEQEIGAGRKEHARRLLDAAYAAFDRKAGR